MNPCLKTSLGSSNVRTDPGLQHPKRAGLNVNQQLSLVGHLAPGRGDLCRQDGYPGGQRAQMKLAQRVTSTSFVLILELGKTDKLRLFLLRENG